MVVACDVLATVETFGLVCDNILDDETCVVALLAFVVNCVEVLSVDEVLEGFTVVEEIMGETVFELEDVTLGVFLAVVAIKASTVLYSLSVVLATAEVVPLEVKDVFVVAVSVVSFVDKFVVV